MEGKVNKMEWLQYVTDTEKISTPALADIEEHFFVYGGIYSAFTSRAKTCLLHKGCSMSLLLIAYLKSPMLIREACCKLR